MDFIKEIQGIDDVGITIMGINGVNASIKRIGSYSSTHRPTIKKSKQGIR
jgi:hypothetical protein